MTNQETEDYWEHFYQSLEESPAVKLSEYLNSNLGVELYEAIDVVYNLTEEEIEEALDWLDEWEDDNSRFLKLPPEWLTKYVDEEYHLGEYD